MNKFVSILSIAIVVCLSSEIFAAVPIAPEAEQAVEMEDEAAGQAETMQFNQLPQDIQNILHSHVQEIMIKTRDYNLESALTNLESYQYSINKTGHLVVHEKSINNKDLSVPGFVNISAKPSPTHDAGTVITFNSAKNSDINHAQFLPLFNSNKITNKKIDISAHKESGKNIQPTSTSALAVRQPGDLATVGTKEDLNTESINQNGFYNKNIQSIIDSANKKLKD